MSEGTKHDNGKLDYSLLPLEFVEDLVPVFALGEERYTFNNWRKDFGPDYERRFLAALKRHLDEVERHGPLAVNEKDGNVYHLAQIAWNALCLLYHAKGKTKLSPLEMLNSMRAESAMTKGE